MSTEGGRISRQRRRRRGAHPHPSRGARVSGLAAAAVAYLADDLRDPEGVARPVLRRAARSLAASRLAALRRAGTTYLRLDPPVVRQVARQAGEASGDGDVIDGVAIDVTEQMRDMRDDDRVDAGR